MPNKSLDASGGSVFLNLPGAAKGALIRAAASTQSFGGLELLGGKDGKIESPVLSCKSSGMGH